MKKLYGKMLIVMILVSLVFGVGFMGFVSFEVNFVTGVLMGLLITTSMISGHVLINAVLSSVKEEE